ASMTLSTRLRDVGLDLGSIGLISLASFFYLLKFLWAPLIDRYAFPLTAFLGRRRSWLLVSQLLVGASLAALALTRPEMDVTALVCWVLVGSFAGATQDSVVDAYRIEVAPASAQAALAATYTLGYRFGLILGGAGAAGQGTGGTGGDGRAPDRFPRRVLAAVRQLLPQQRRGARPGAAAVRRPVQVPRPGDRGDGRAVLPRLGLQQGRHRDRV